MSTQMTDSTTTPPDTVPPASADQAGDGRRLSLTGHLDEVRHRLWISVGAVLAATVACFAVAGVLVEWLKRPAGSALQQLAFFGPAEAMLAYLKVAMAAGVVICMPLLLYELWAFITPGLTPRERRYGIAFIWWGSALFLLGCAFAYWALLPVSLAFLLGFGGEQLQPVIHVSRYLSFTTSVLLASGAIFQLPLVVYILAKLGLLHPQTLRRQWRAAVLIMVVAAAIITPTADAATMLLMVLPMLGLYEVSIWVAKLATPRQVRDE